MGWLVGDGDEMPSLYVVEDGKYMGSLIRWMGWMVGDEMVGDGDEMSMERVPCHITMSVSWGLVMGEMISK
jgi:hypothetical protein